MENQKPGLDAVSSPSSSCSTLVVGLGVLRLTLDAENVVAAGRRGGGGGAVGTNDGDDEGSRVVGAKEGPSVGAPVGDLATVLAETVIGESRATVREGAKSERGNGAVAAAAGVRFRSGAPAGAASARRSLWSASTRRH